MKKLIALLLALTLVVAFAGCEKKEETKVETVEALAALQTAWNALGDDEKPFAMGGGYETMVDNAPGAVPTTDTAYLTSILLVPADQIANIDEAASLVNGMMLNNFTCGAFHVTGDVKAFADAMNTAISTNRWMCGMPEKMFVAVIGEYVVAAFGLNDFMNTFESKLSAAYPAVEYAYNAAITG